MSGDARFEDGAEAPLYLGAVTPEDLGILSALMQDAVLTAADMRHDARQREFALIVNRLRHEVAGAERVRAGLIFRDVLAVKVQGITPRDGDVVLALLALEWQPGADGAGRVILTFAGDGAIALEVEALDASLRDLTQSWPAPAGRAPDHG